MQEPKKKAGRPKKDTKRRAVMMTQTHYDKAILIGGKLCDGVALALDSYKVKVSQNE